MRKTILFNENWTFRKPGEEAVTINLPHTWNAEDGQGRADYFRGVCTYEKEFEKPALTEHERVYLEFRGVNSSAKVAVNGKEAVRHDGGYSTFRADITDFLQDKNLLTVEADNLANDRVYPQKADFTFYGGIYRDVYLVIVNENHFEMDYYGGSGFAVTPMLNGESAEVRFDAYIAGNADVVKVDVEGVGSVMLTLDESERAASMKSSVPVSDKEGPVRHKATGSLTIENVHRWDGLNDPYLYAVKASLIKEGTVVDEVSDRFGCREYSVDPEKGFFLNGKSYPLHGVSRHQDRMGAGNALTPAMHEEDMELILSMGANSIRLAHYQHDQYFYDLCDEKGLIAWAEIPYITVHMDSGRENTIQQMKELITQNYNHASIFCWALSNEISLQGVADDLMENHKILNDLVHEMDPHRFSAMANLFLLETDSPLVTLPDIRGYNLYYGWYVGEMEDNDEWFDDFHREHPDVAIGLTEYGADSVISLQSPRPQKGDFTESYQALYHEHMLEMFSTRPYIWGTYVWNMFEFAAAGREDANDPGKNHKGLITFDRRQKKDAYYIYKAWWTTEPFVHLCGKRYHDRVEEMTEIKVYSNCSSVTLYVDGAEAGTREGAHVFKFNIPISGAHKVKAVGRLAGETAGFDVTADQAVGSECADEMEIAKVSEPNPAYFASADKVKNWFDEEEDGGGEAGDEYLSLNSTMAEVKAVPEGAVLLEQMMSQMASKTAGGMGEGVQIPAAMQKMIERQPLKKLLAQGGIELDSEPAKMLEAALRKIKK